MNDKAATSPAATKADGTVLLRLEKIEGFFTEGFDLQVRLEAPSGHPVLSSSWADLVRGQKSKPAGLAFYSSVIRTSVPAGAFEVSTVMDLGMEPAQPTCVTRGQVEPGASVTVTLNFSAQDGCSTLATGG
ncbi:MAG TPA: hypothetical protein VLJ88_01985 [Propionibacteriaceae bacterium]|nr:hypothetical protein [Propionibacteriaceae bacterium]